MGRYDRHISLAKIGKSGQLLISNAKVLVIGAGGLGCPILQYLTAAGVGKIGIVDFDTVSLSNLQRQILYGTSSIGTNKAKAAKSRLEDLNDTISITSYEYQLTHQNAIELFLQYDIIVDGTDNFETRYLINDASLITNKPLVYGAIYKFEGQVSVFNYSNGPSYRCLFPIPPSKGTIPNCEDIGVLGVLPGIIGTMQANEVLKIILKLGNVLSGKLYCYNALTTSSNSYIIQKDEVEINKILEHKDKFNRQLTTSLCTLESTEISANEIIKNSDLSDYIFIDVREDGELPKIEMITTNYIPLSSIESRMNEIDKTKPIILFCQSGKRSMTATKILRRHGYDNCLSLRGGIASALVIAQYIDNKNKMGDKKIKNVFKTGAIPSEFVGKAIGNHQSKTNIGAHNIFLGQVRADKIGDKVVAGILYSAYEEMANNTFHEIREAAFSKYELSCMHIYHSIGEVKVGEICLFVFVSSPHRKASFDALSYIVEEIKEKVPVFGKEIFEDESYQWKVNN